MTRFLLAAILVFFAIFTAGTALTQVQPGERAVVRRWGRVLPEHPAPGLHIGLPWGIDRVDRVSIGSVRRVIVGFRDEAADENPTPVGQMLTGDHNLVNAQAEIDYTVREDDIESFVLLSDRADVLVSRVAESVLAEWIAGRTVDEALLRGKALLPGVLIDEVNRRLDEYKLGVRVEQASLTRLNPPEEVRPEFERVAKAQTGIDTQVNQAEQEANSKRQRADAERFGMKTSAEAYANAAVLQATAEAQAFLNRLDQYRLFSKAQPDYLNVLWREDITRLYVKLREGNRVRLLDQRLGDLNIMEFPMEGKKK
jgi:membrane protease subunit HflK